MVNRRVQSAERLRCALQTDNDPPAPDSRHDVVDGDTLWPLRAYYYGDTGDDGRTQTMVEMVTAANHIDDPDQLEVGQVA